MARYNHFATKCREKIEFTLLSIGDKFRKDFFKGKRRRTDILCQKTGELSFMEVKSKKEYKLLSAANYQVSAA